MLTELFTDYSLHLKTTISQNLRRTLAICFNVIVALHSSLLLVIERGSTTTWCKAMLTERLLNTGVSCMADQIHIYWLWLYFIQRRHQLYRSCKKGKSLLYKTKDLNYLHGFTRRVEIKCKLVSIHWPVREITKSSSTFSATNISSNMIWLLQLHDTIQMKSNYTSINYNHGNITIRSHIMIYNGALTLFLLPNLVAFISKKEKNVWFFDYTLLTCSVRKMVLMCWVQNINMCLLYKFHQIARLVSHLINYISKWMFTVEQDSATKFGNKNIGNKNTIFL